MFTGIISIAVIQDIEDHTGIRIDIEFEQGK